ncbi:hypothetical protein [Actinoalloteichus sp. GBA129-24]|uniref:hypothetical protein n=1 Tax=Actinoalloteichus sp. GBA129-24 TaxID=1612551 RepID=UPI000950919A|nr:hypothetical protein [Actinoalloteichus sp. GBA129-24]APU20932.1 hypothetical protein UA75_14610 [Actinoalloteichus sp. GBA129-24]APU24181.1 hypothetical protein UA75_31090 [Actinoalloteichus sp. GBA129-24]
MNTCSACEAPTDIALCPRCVARLTRALGQVPELDRELEITITRQAAQRPVSGGRSAETVVSFHEDASAIKRTLLAALARAVRAVHQPDPGTHVFLPAGVHHTLTGLSTWLSTRPRPTWLATHEDAAAFAEDIHDAVSAAWRIIDRGPDRRWIGPCDTGDCRADVRAIEGRTTATCRECGAEHDVEQRLAWMVESVRGLTGGAAEITATLRAVGVDIPATRIRTWASRRRLAAVSPGVYRVADVLDLNRPAEIAA